MSESVAERTLIDAAQVGDATIVEQLLLSHFSALERHIAPKIPAAARRQLAVEDVLQDTFAQAFRDIARFDSNANASFLAWLKGIADHRLADAVKRISRKKRGGDRQQLSAVDSKASSICQFIEIICHDSDTPTRIAARKEAAKAIQVAVAGLPEHQRDVVWARFIEHKSVEEIAQQTGRTEGAVRGLIDRAKAKLRDAMGRSTRWFSKR